MFVQCHCHLLQLACVEAANATGGIKQVYITHHPGNFSLLSQASWESKRGPTSAWSTWAEDCETVRYSLAGTWTLCEGSQSQLQCNCECSKRHLWADTQTWSSRYQQIPLSTVSVIYLLNYVLPQVAKLSRALQTGRIDLTANTALVDATLNTLDNVTLPAADWVLELIDAWMR